MPFASVEGTTDGTTHPIQVPYASAAPKPLPPPPPPLVPSAPSPVVRCVQSFQDQGGASGVGSLHALLRGFLGKAQPSLTVVAGPRIGAAKEGRKALGLRNGLRQEQKDEGGRIVVATVCYVRSRCARHEEIPCAAVAERDRRQPAIGADRHDNVSGQEFTGKGPRKRYGLWLMALSNVWGLGKRPRPETHHHWWQWRWREVSADSTLRFHRAQVDSSIFKSMYKIHERQSRI